ncbi:MAG TPA: PASTA domain-containing protein [Cellulomonadaceae bacterium]|nr:PASTA domain-containing protein [Cellulomonadaceae bacterium]
MDRRQAARLAPVAFACLVVVLAGCASRPGSSAPVPTTAAVRATPTPSPTVVSQVFIVPTLVGDPLSEARDTLQSLGSYSLDPQDASGRGRAVTVDASWQVCTQSPLAGEVVDARTVVILTSVVVGESCP